MKTQLGLMVLVLACAGCGDDDEGTGGSTTTGGSGAAGANGSGAAGTGGSGAGATGGSSTGGTSDGGGGGTAGAGGSVPCVPDCEVGLECCNGVCVNQNNDIKNCGDCDNECMEVNPFCDNGTCGMAPCNGGVCNDPEFCCGTQCCDAGMLCCVVPAGPVGPPTCTMPTDAGSCPPGNPGSVCAAPDTPVATPTGDRAIADLRVGDLVYSMHRDSLVAVPIERIHRTAVTHHRVMRVRLNNGAELMISPGHPTADGETFAQLTRGDVMYGPTVVEVALVPYPHAFTHDILPASDSGAYFTAGALIGSTLADDARPVAGASLQVRAAAGR